MLTQEDKQLLSRLERVLRKMGRTISLYKKELKNGTFKPRNGTMWERTIEKQMVEVAITELQDLTEEESLEEMCKLIDNMEEFVKKARVVDA
jgi:hypothetical protein